jgi:hypothetical protein
MPVLAFFNFSGPEMILVICAALLPLYCIIDIIRSDFKDSTTKLLWALVVIFIGLIGPILYLTIGRQSKVRSN